MPRIRLAPFLIPVLLAALAACERSPVRNDPDPDPDPPQDPRAAWLAQNAVRLASLSPANTDFADLQPLKAAIGDARVVMLGEQSHGDGTTFLAKARLVKFLHQEMGFDVLAFESGLYDVRKSWERIQQGEDALTAVRRGVFGIWTFSEQVQPVFEYVEANARGARPLEVAGFDAQFTGSASRDFLVGDLRAFLERNGSGTPGLAAWHGYAATLEALVRGLHYSARPPAEEQAAFRAAVQELLAETAGWPGGEAAFWRQLLRSADAHAVAVWLRDPDDPQVEDWNRRDRQMADNLVWLAQEAYPGRRIIVWAATSHVARNLPAVDRMGEFTFDGWTTLGHEAHARLGSDVYAIGFTAREGAYGRAGAAPTPLDPPVSGSLEWLMHAAELQNAFVDFRNRPADGAWLTQPLVARPMGYANNRADWTQVLDAMIYTRVMAPSTAAQ